jgi:cob(I)alamin adenosyltransferase
VRVHRRAWSALRSVLGDLDELSAYIGYLCASGINEEDSRLMRYIQSFLLDLGSNFATTTRRDKIKTTTLDDIKKIEDAIDFYDQKSPKLTEFILPGVNLKDSTAHICRSICRRAERNMWKLRNQYEETFYVENETFHYVNRLSDFFFAFARYLSDGKEFRRSGVY